MMMILKGMNKEMKDQIIKIMNKCKELGEIPDRWKVSVITLLQKDKDKSHIPTEYRPISLLDTLYKVYTTWLYWELREHVREKEILSDVQMGGKEGLGTADAVFSIMGVMEDAKEFNKPLYLFAADIVKAFDSIEHWAIKQILTSYGVNEELIKAIMGCYDNIRARIKMGEEKTTEEFAQTRGVRQGDVLSPLIFNLVMNPGLEYVRKLGKGYKMGERGEGEQVSVIAYVDDDTLVAGTVEDLEEMIKQLGKFYESIGLTLSKTKSVLLANREEAQIEIIIKGELVRFKAKKREETIRMVGGH